MFFVSLRKKPRALFEKSGLLDVVGEGNLYRKVSDAIETIEKDMMNRGVVSISQ